MTDDSQIQRWFLFDSHARRKTTIKRLKGQYAYPESDECPYHNAIPVAFEAISDTATTAKRGFSPLIRWRRAFGHFTGVRARELRNLRELHPVK